MKFIVALGLALSRFGAVDPARLKRSIGVISDLYGLPTTPGAAAVFTDAFLPAQDARMF